MLRRVVRVLRVGLFALGWMFVGVLPLIYLITTRASLPWPGAMTAIRAARGYVLIYNVWHDPFLEKYPQFFFDLTRVEDVGVRSKAEALKALIPSYSVRAAGYDVSVTNYSRVLEVPIWLLAAACLAWPVTSFILARRRHKRGFPVEPKGGVDAVSTPVSSS